MTDLEFTVKGNETLLQRIFGVQDNGISDNVNLNISPPVNGWEKGVSYKVLDGQFVKMDTATTGDVTIDTDTTDTVLTKDLNTYVMFDRISQALKNDSRFGDVLLLDVFPDLRYCTFYKYRVVSEEYDYPRRLVDREKIYKIGFTVYKDDTVTIDEGEATHVVPTYVDWETRTIKALQEKGGGLGVYKKDDNSNSEWVAVYSNNLEDKEHETITEKAHNFYVKAVESGAFPMPELWLAHSPGARIGKANRVWLDRHDNGVVFAMAKGTFNDGMEDVAKVIQDKGYTNSHGMVYVKRNTENDKQIDEYLSIEITALPAGFEANEYTGNFVNLTELEKMSTNKTLMETLKEDGMPDSMIEAIQEANKARAEKADKESVARKGDEAETEETPATETAKDEKSLDPDAPITRKELHETLASFGSEIADKVYDAISEIKADTSEMKKKEDISLASFSAMWEQKASAVGKDETRVHGNDSLVKSKQNNPQETEDDGDIFSKLFANGI